MSELVDLGGYYCLRFKYKSNGQFKELTFCIANNSSQLISRDNCFGVNINELLKEVDSYIVISEDE